MTRATRIPTNRRETVERRRWWLAGSTATTAVILAWALWPTAEPMPPRARQYLDFTACLLTSEQGITEPDAVPVWAGLQDASLATHAKVQYLAITGPQNVDNGQTFIATMTQTHCNLIFAAGTVPIASVEKNAASFPNTRFYLIGNGTPRTNISIVDSHSPEQTRTAVSQLVTKVVPST